MVQKTVSVFMALLLVFTSVTPGIIVLANEEESPSLTRAEQRSNPEKEARQENRDGQSEKHEGRFEIHKNFSTEKETELRTKLKDFEKKEKTPETEGKIKKFREERRSLVGAKNLLPLDQQNEWKTHEQVLEDININIKADFEKAVIETFTAEEKADLGNLEPDYIASSLEIPNDTEYVNEWGMKAISYPPYKGDAGGNSSSPTPQPPLQGGQMVVAILDTGISLTHEDAPANILAGYDFVENDATPQDDNGHGTAISGIIAAKTNNSVGIASVCPNCTILPVRVLDADGLGTYSAIADGIRYAADNGAKVINLSLGASFASTVLGDAVAYAQSKGVVLVAAGGNYGKAQLMYPAAYAGVIGVGSVNESLAHSSFSNTGAHIALVAPGENIITLNKDGGYKSVNGTSFSTAFVTGMVGEMGIIKNEELGIKNGGTLSDWGIVISDLLANTKDLGDAGRDDIFGAGLLQYPPVSVIPGTDPGSSGGSVTPTPTPTPVPGDGGTVLADDGLNLSPLEKKLLLVAEEKIKAYSYIGKYELFDVSTYYNLNDTPKYKLFTFYFLKNGPMPTHEEVRKMVREKWAEAKKLKKEKEDLYTRANNKELGVKEYWIQEGILAKKISELNREREGWGKFETVMLTADEENPKDYGTALSSYFKNLPYIEEVIQKTQSVQGYTLGRVYVTEEGSYYYGLVSPELQALGITEAPPVFADVYTEIHSRASLESEKKIGISAAGTGGDILAMGLDKANFAIPYTVVITNGFQPNGDYPSDWINPMADAIFSKIKGEARIYKFNPATSRFEPDGGNPFSPHTVLKMDWAESSNDVGPGYSEAAGEALFGALMDGYERGLFSLQNVHFIGHSRGTVVNSEAIERLLWITDSTNTEKTKRAGLARPNIQVTTLDPHDNGILDGKLYSDYDVNTSIPNNGVISWKGTRFADNYYSTDNRRSKVIVDPDGRHVGGTYERLLADDSCAELIGYDQQGNSIYDYSKCIGHSEVHEWYRGTINQEAVDVPTWWYDGQGGREARSVGGFNHAIDLFEGKGVPSDFPEQKADTQFRFTDPAQGIMNGDFRRSPGDTVTPIDYPGWYYFGGSGNAKIEGEKLVLNDTNRGIIHNYFSIPPKTKAIAFRLHIEKEDPINTLELSLIHI